MEIIQENQEESVKTIEKELNAALAIDPEVKEENADPEVVKVGDILTREEFNNKFIELFDLAEDLTQIEGLRVKRDSGFEMSGAKATANRLYDCAEKYKIMRFLIQNNGGWLGDALLIGSFCYVKANIVAFHYSGHGLFYRLRQKLKKRVPENVQEKAGIFTKFFMKDKINESEKTK